jgi:hypothetical protein
MMSGLDMCLYEGCRGDGHCPDCGRTNYRLLGYHGAVARWASAWNITRNQAEDRITRHAVEYDVKARLMSREDADEVLAELTDPPETQRRERKGAQGAAR